MAQGQLALYHYDGNERDVIVDVLQKDDLLGWLPYEAKALGQEAILYCLSRSHVDRIAATHYTYDDRHDVSTITDARANSTTYEYQDAGPNGSTGLLSAVEQPAIGSDLHPVTTTYSYDPTTYDLIERDTDRGGRTLYRYDGDHHAVLATATLLDASANTWTGSVNTYDSHGELLSTVDGRGLMPSNDPAMPVAVDAALAPAYTRSWTYTDDGDVATASTAPITTTAHGTTQANMPVVTRFSYDDDGNLRATTSPNGETTTYDYDGLGRPTRTQHPTVPVDGGATQTPVDTTQYDGDGNVTRQSDALNHATSYDYDALGRPIAITNPLGASTILTYTATHLAKIRDSRGNVTSYTYDAADRLSKVTDALGVATTYGYDADGNLTGMAQPLDTSGAATVEQRVYDALNEVVSDTIGGSDEDTPTPSQTTTFGYDHDGHLVRQRAPNGDETGASFDLAGRPTTQTLYPSADTPSVAQQTLSFDAAGNLGDVVDYMGRDHRRTIDGDNRLTQEIDCSGPCPDVNGVVTTMESGPDGNTLAVTQAVPVATATTAAMRAAALSPSLTASRTNATEGPGSSAAPAKRQAQQARPKVFRWTLPAGRTRPERSPTSTATRPIGTVHTATMKQRPALSRPALVLSDRILVHGALAMVRAAVLTTVASVPTGCRTAGPAPILGHPIPPAFRRSMVKRGRSPEAAPTSGVPPTNSTSPGRSAPAIRA